MTKRVSVGRSTGKFILLGEHFVVHGGVPALAFPLSELWCEVRLQPDDLPHYVARFPAGEDREVVESYMARATYAAADCLRIDIAAQPLRVESRTNFPISRGFGSSAAFAVALARAFDVYRKSMIGEAADWQELVKTTGTIERIFHGSPSGVDTAVILAGRPIRFENGAILREVNNGAVDFIALDSGSRESCAPLIKRVAVAREQNPAHWERLAAMMCQMVDECERGLQSGNAEAVAAMVRGAHGVLSELGLSSPAIDELIDEGCMLGALAGKVSGAGGGGAVILVAPRGTGDQIAQKLHERGRAVLAVEPRSDEKKRER